MIVSVGYIAKPVRTNKSLKENFQKWEIFLVLLLVWFLVLVFIHTDSKTKQKNPDEQRTLKQI